MSTPAAEQQRTQERAAWLADIAANALHSARGSLGRAAHVTQEVDNYLRRSEEELAYLPGQANQVRAAEGETRPFVRNAQHLAGTADDRIRHGQAGIAEVRNQLDQGANALRAGREALNELSTLPVQHDTAAMVRLAYKIGALDNAVQNAHHGMDEASRRLTSARDSLAPLVNGAPTQDRESTAALINQSATAADTQLANARLGLGTLNESFATTQGDSQAAAADSADLARHFAAAANPTPSAAQQHQPAAGDEAHKPKESEIASRLRGL
ncbi:hypothetical protein E1263_02030 [Kribbella antibiotica]|uniref:Uncharacterized protein n=1 Tax=Kribbella antibiotica TaxID=190195 RepID=A0A4R4ZW09_9ACTN|nr:hypothetical protein [Kribbella antibiotica]TDD63105.1 hypothetical protein E1263_02030 [Kribbella antibiotica]